MSDLWKPGPVAETSAPPLEVVVEPAGDHDWFNGESADVPFIEVGDRPEPKLKLIEPMPIESAIVNPNVEPASVLKLNSESLPPGLFTIRFRPVIAGELPGRGFGNEIITFHDSDHPVSEQYRLLLAEIALQLPNGPPRVLVFSGATAESGTTTVVMNLAVTIARTGASRVTVIDANLARPALAERLGLSSSPGLREVLGGRTPISWAVQNTRMPALRALAAGRAVGPINESALPLILEKLCADSDYVLIDAPTWTNPAESVPLADCGDALYLVIRQPDADTDQARELQQGFLETTGRLKGCILTQR
jgi:Mrp family chromosome partitioning ATPase